MGPRSPGPRRRAAAALVLVLAAAPAAALDHGEYIFRIAGCAACHTAPHGPFLAGGRAFETPFGTFYSANITPDRRYGIGTWSADDLMRALHDGRARNGDDLYPVFPYPSYAGMRRDDVLALYGYLRTVKPVPKPRMIDAVPWYMRFRIVNRIWKLLFMRPPRFADPSRPASWNRGAYLVNAVAHCPECHSPRNRFGALVRERFLAGNPHGPDGKRVPDITPDAKDGIGGWSTGDIVDYLQSGLLPSGDVVGGPMAEVIDQGLKYLTTEDARAIAQYLRSLPPLPKR